MRYHNSHWGIFDAFHNVGRGLWTLWGISAGFILCEYRYRFLLIESHPFGTTLNLQLSFYQPLSYNSRAHCPLLQFLRTTSAILAGANYYFVKSLFKCEGRNSCHELILNPLNPSSGYFPFHLTLAQ